MMRARDALVASILAAGCGGGDHPVAVASSVSPPAAPPAASNSARPAPEPLHLVDHPEIPMHSYVTAYANARHDSRVELPSFLPKTLVRDQDLTAGVDEGSGGGGEPVGVPRFVLTSPEAKHVVVVGSLFFVERSTDASRSRGDVAGPRAHVLGEHARWTGFDAIDWGAGAHSNSIKWPTGPVLAARAEAAGWTEIVSIAGGEQSYAKTYIARIAAETLTLSVVDSYAVDAFLDGAHAVVLSGSKVARYTTETSPMGSVTAEPAKQVFSKPVDVRFSMASGPNGDIALVHVKHPQPSQGDPSLRSTITVLYSADGSERWSATVPWEVRQPPVDGGQGRVLVAGDGLTALEEGVELWSIPPMEQTIRATAFSDGAVAITKGSALQILSREGNVVSTLATPDGESLITPPAIASDGSIWAASRDHLYVAR
ncbi:MAG: hypothetical protein U0414_18350 [Polyangiaceae bacterium]